MADQELSTKYTADMKEWDAAVAKAIADMSKLDSYLRKATQAHNLSARATKDDAVQQSQLVAALNSLKRGLSETNASIAKNTTSLKSNSDQAKTAAKEYDQTGTSLASFAKGYLTVAAVMGAGQIFLDSTKEVTKYENQLKVASGTTEEYAKNTQFLEGLAAKYNKNVIDLGSNFAKLTIATKGTNLEGAQTEKLFAAVTATSAALQMSVDDTNGTFNAFIQMVSKGNVQAEELRGQLGERLYGAFNLAAKSMGVTTSELNKMLERGEVMASDLLPKLTVELENTFGKDAEKNAHNLGSAIEYATGQLTLLIAETGKSSGLTDFFAQAAKDAGGLFSQLRLLNKEKGLFAAAGGLAGAVLETGLNGTGYSSPALNYARGRQNAPIKGPLLDTSRDRLSSSEDYGKQFGIRDTDPKTEEKLRKANESAANKANTAVNKWVSEQIQASKDRIAVAFAAIEAQNQPDLKRHGTLSGTAIGMADSRGITQGYDKVTDENVTKKFTNQPGAGMSLNIDRIAAGMTEAVKKHAAAIDAFKNENSELAEESLRIESISENLEDGIMDMYGSMAAATEAGWGSVIEKVKAGTLSYSEALMAITRLDAIDNIEQMTKDLQINLVSGISESIGAIAAGGAGIEDLMSNIYSTFGGFLMNLGKQLLVTSGVFKGLKAALMTLSGPVAAIAGAAAIAAGAALKSYASNSGKKTAGSFYTGGVIQGRTGVDNLTANVSAGEMILNKSQQSNLFAMLDHGFSGSMFRNNQLSQSSGQFGSGVLKAKLRGDYLDILVDRGSERNKRYR